jgi:hypothetical protein
MTLEEREEALYIIETYREMSNGFEDVLESLDELEKKKDKMMRDLEALKIKENEFMARYREKYGDRNLLEDLNSGTDQ